MNKAKAALEAMAVAEAQFTVARDAMESARDAHYQAIVVPKLKKRLGKCFRCRTGYGGERQWWVYVLITGFDANERGLASVRVERNMDGAASVADGVERVTYDGEFQQDLQAISRAQFNHAARPILGDLKRKLGF